MLCSSHRQTEAPRVSTRNLAEINQFCMNIGCITRADCLLAITQNRIGGISASSELLLHSSVHSPLTVNTITYVITESQYGS
jgi:hypothetical protein